MEKLIVYGDRISGNCYKIALLLELLGRTYHWVPIDILVGQAATEDFARLNPNAKIPALVIDNRETLWESNAILNYLATGTRYLPEDSLARARMLQWQFFEQYSHEPNIAVARFINKYQGLPASRAEEYAQKQPGGHKALTVMDHALAESTFLVGSEPSLADLSLYAYTHVAHEGGFDLSKYNHVTRWLQAIKALPGFVGMEDDWPHCQSS